MKGSDFIKPNVLCIGFAKCGTTTLYDILKQHPNIYLSGIKEPIYYGNRKIEPKGFKWYLNRYYPKKVKQKIIMEINPIIGKYVPAKRIKKDYGENIKIIIMIRNPIKRLYSNFKMNLMKGDCFANKKDNIGDISHLFDKWVADNFIDDDLKIISNNVIPKFCKSGDYYNKILDYCSIFGMSNVKIIVFEEFIKNTKGVCEELYDFIGVESVKNINYNIHSNDGNRIVTNTFNLALNRIFLNYIWPNFFIKHVGFVSHQFSSLLNNFVWNYPKFFTKKTKQRDNCSLFSEIILKSYYSEMIGNLSSLLKVNFYKKWDIEKSINISKEDIISFILITKYGDALREIKKEYVNCSKGLFENRLLNNMYDNEKIVISLVKDIIFYYDELKLCNIIFLNGSFSRCTPTYSSDVDINLIYENDHRDKIFPIELKVNYIISNVMGFRGCDRVHTMMVYTKRINNYKEEIIKNRLIVYKNQTIQYYCRDNYSKLLNDTFNTSRNINCLSRYLRDTIYNRGIFYEWLFNFQIIYDNDNVFMTQIDDDYNAILKLKNFNTKIENELDDLILTINQNMLKKSEYIYISGGISISKMKRKYKTNILDQLYKIILIFNYINCDKYMNFYSLVTSKKGASNLKKSMLLALNLISRLQIVLDNLGYDLSSHSDKIIDEKLFYREYYKIYKNNYIYDLNCIESKTYKVMIKLINQLKKEI